MIQEFDGYLPMNELTEEIKRKKYRTLFIVMSSTSIAEVVLRLIDEMNAGYIMIHTTSNRKRSHERFSNKDVTTHLQVHPSSNLVYRYALPITLVALQKLCETYSSLVFQIENQYYELHVRFSVQPAKINTVKSICEYRDQTNISNEQRIEIMNRLSQEIDSSFRMRVTPYLV